MFKKLAASVGIVLVTAVLGAPAAHADTGNRANCGTVVSGVNAMKSQTGSYSVVAYPKACTKRYFNGSTYVYYFPWTKSPAVDLQGSCVATACYVSSAPHYATQTTDGGGRVTSVRYDFTTRLDAFGGAGTTYTSWRIYIYPSGTNLYRRNADGNWVSDSFDPWD